MKRLSWKLLCLALPFASIAVAELFFLPRAFFTFRVWEALAVKEYQSHLPGWFYPNERVEKTEEGDLAHGTTLAVAKPVRWVTDAWGYRNDPELPQTVPVLLVGDSQVVGASLTQEDTLPVRLAEVLHRPVYGLAPATINTFLRDPRYRAHPPEVVVLEAVERSLPTLEEVDPAASARPAPPPLTPGAWHPFWTLADRARNLTVVLMLRARLDGTRIEVVRSPRSRMCFQTPAYAEWAPEALEELTAKLDRYRQALAGRGIRMVFMPVPEKETVYFANLPVPAQNLSLGRLVARLRTAGIEVVDLPEVFARHAERYGPDRELLYQLDDTHWSPTGVRAAAVVAAATLLRPHPAGAAPGDSGR